MAGELINMERLELYDQEIKEYIKNTIPDELDVTAVVANTISINNTPTADNHAVTKKYLEEYVENALLNGAW